MSRIAFAPLTPRRWDDLATLFSTSAVTRGCWCMWWRLPRAEFHRAGADERRAALRRLTEQRAPLGVLAYLDGQPAGWCSVSPREQLPGLERSRALPRIDDAPVWSIVCLYVPRAFRGQGLAVGLIRAAVDMARAAGATVVEAYPREAGGSRIDSGSAYVGVPSMFRQAGFREVARPSPSRRIMRRGLRPRRIWARSDGGTGRPRR